MLTTIPTCLKDTNEYGRPFERRKQKKRNVNFERRTKSCILLRPSQMRFFVWKLGALQSKGWFVNLTKTNNDQYRRITYFQNQNESSSPPSGIKSLPTPVSVSIPFVHNDVHLCGSRLRSINNSTCCMAPLHIYRVTLFKNYMIILLLSQPFPMIYYVFECFLLICLLVPPKQAFEADFYPKTKCICSVTIQNKFWRFEYQQQNRCLKKLQQIDFVPAANDNLELFRRRKLNGTVVVILWRQDDFARLERCHPFSKQEQ